MLLKMRINIESKDVKITEYTKKYILQKLGTDLDRLIKRLPDDVKVADVLIKSGTRWGYTVSFSMVLPKKEHIFAETKHKDLVTAVNLLKDELQEVIRRYKEKKRDY